MDPDSTLAKTTKMVRQKEVVHQHNTQLQGGLDTKFLIDLSPIERTRTDKTVKGAHASYHKGDGSGIRPLGKSHLKHCARCGKAAHPVGTLCPASGATCKRCMRKGHYASQCFSKTVKLG